MKSNKQRRTEILSKRRARKQEESRARAGQLVRDLPEGTAPCNPALLAPYNSYGQPPFVARGHYVDAPFTCTGCGKEEVWRATQQKWWYEVAKGNVESRANRCTSCRRAERERQAQARRVHLEGIQRKKAAAGKPH